MAAEQRWDGNFEAVKHFHGVHGRWPTQKRDGALGTWCKTQRSAKKGRGGKRISPAQIAKLDGIGFDWGKTRTSKQTVEPAGPAAEPQQRKKAAPSRKRVHKADKEGRPATRRATEPQALPMAATAAFWAATPVAVAPDAANTAAPSAAAAVPRERAGLKTPLLGTTFDYGDVIKTNF